MPQQMTGMQAAGGIGGAAGNIFGGILGVAAAQGEQDKMNQQLAQSLAALHGYGVLNNNTFQQSLHNTGFVGANHNLQQGQHDFLKAYQGMHMPGFTQPQGPAGMLGSIGTQKLGLSNAAKMAGYQNLGFQIPLSNMQAEGKLGMNNQLAQESMISFAPLMAQASTSKGAMGALGSLLGTGSTIAGQYMMLPQQQAAMGSPNNQQMNALNMGFGPVNANYAKQLNGFPAGTLGFGSPLY